MVNYKYKFNDSFVDIDVDEEWLSVLKEMDRTERNTNIKEQHGHFSLDAHDYTAETIGKEDQNLLALFDGSPVYEYALKHLLPRHQIILFRRGVLGDRLVDIGSTYGVSASAIHHYYTNICKRFLKFYTDGAWLFSSKNTSSVGTDKVSDIPFGLTPAQIMAIRAYRMDYKSIDQIAMLVGVPINRVKRCLKTNPILETNCPFCEVALKQPVYGVMRIFCSPGCYYKWYRCHGMEGILPGERNQNLPLSTAERFMIWHYQKHGLSQEEIHTITGISDQKISAFFYAHQPVCRHCGAQIPFDPDKQIKKYCSKKCSDKWHNENRKKKQKNEARGRPRLELFSCEQLQNIANMWEANEPENTIKEALCLPVYRIKRLKAEYNRCQSFFHDFQRSPISAVMRE